MIGAAVTFGIQDGLSRFLAEGYGPISVITIRYWFFLLFVLAFSATRPGGLKHVAGTTRPWLQTLRALLLVSQIARHYTASLSSGLSAFR